MIRLFLKRAYSSKVWSFEEATAWQQGFNKKAIPKEHVTITFSRSSGPGGQNVNKVSTKVDMRLSLGKVHWLPDYAKERLRSFSHFHTNKQDELIITSDKTRSQAKNVQDCYDKLVTVIKQSVSVQKEADEATIAKIEAFKQAENKKRKLLKTKHTQKKTDRRSKGNDF